MTRLGVANIDCRQDGAALDPKWGRASYLFNATIAGIEKADALLIVGSNPRREAAVLNGRIRKRWRAGAIPIGMIGERADLTYPYEYLGAGPQTLADVASGTHEFGKVLKQAQHPLVIVGMGALARPDGAAVASLAARAAQGAGTARLERLFGLAHGGITRRCARRRLRARYRRPQRARDGGSRRARRGVPAGGR